MQELFDGTIMLNHPLTKKEADVFNNILYLEFLEYTVYEGDDSASIKTCGRRTSTDFCDELETVIREVSPFGCILNGTISYSGDYGDGTITVKDNVVEDYSADEYAIIKADDAALIDELRSRGYTVAPKKRTVPDDYCCVHYAITGRYDAYVPKGTIEEMKAAGIQEYYGADFGDLHEAEADIVYIQDADGNFLYEK